MVQSRPGSVQSDETHATTDITQTTQAEALCTVNKAEDLALRARGKFKDFQRAFDKEDALNAVDGSNRVIQQRCARIKLVFWWIIALSILTTGFVLIVLASMRMSEVEGANEGTCRIIDYTDEYGVAFNPANTWRDLCSVCKFLVQMESDDFGLVNVQSWTIEFEGGYHTGKAEVVHEQFHCCPTEPSVNCCNFFEEVTGTFCDNWGQKVDGACPYAPWPCYVLNLEEKLDEAARTGNPIPPESLKVGKLGLEKILLAIGTGLFVIGFCATNWLAPCAWYIFRWLIGVKNSARVDAAMLSCVRKYVPVACRSKKTQSRIVRIDAAVVIQRWWRSKLSKKRQSMHIRQMPQGFEGLSIVSEETELFVEEAADSWAKQDAADRILTANRVHKKILEAKNNPQIGISLAPPPKAKYAVGARLLHDTGNADTSRKLASHRILSDPDARVQRVEIALLESRTVFNLRDILYLPHRGAKDTRPKVTQVPHGKGLETLGLQPGHRLTRVGTATYPSVNGAQLMRALTETPRPVFMIFEGVTAPHKNPSWAEEWQKNHVPIPFHNAPWTRQGQQWQTNQKDRGLSRKILPIENANAYAEAFTTEHSNSPSLLRLAANPHQGSGRTRTRSGSLPQSESSSRKHILQNDSASRSNSRNLQGRVSPPCESEPLPPAATPPVMLLLNRPSLTQKHS